MNKPDRERAERLDELEEIRKEINEITSRLSSLIVRERNDLMFKHQEESQTEKSQTEEQKQADLNLSKIARVTDE